jgi:hypothetical protein
MRARAATIAPHYVIVSLCVLLYANWVWAIARFQPNVLFMDQWDFFESLFYGGNWWDRFVHQHGPVREGLGFVVSGWILEATSLDVRYDSVWIATVLLGATVLALRLKLRMAGPLRFVDAWIPILFLSLGQFETVVSTPNASHSVVPLALILLAANVWLSARAEIRYVVTAAIAVALTFTGFGLFAGAVIAVLLAAHALRHALQQEGRLMRFAAGGFAVTVLSWLVFTRGYLFQPAVEGFRFPWTPWTDYVRFVTLMVHLPTWHAGASAPHYRMGGVLVFVLAVAAVTSIAAWIKRQPSLDDDVRVLLLGSGLLFIVMTAVGRISLGVTAGEASRYLSLMFPAWLAVYLAPWSSRIGRAVATGCVWLLALAPYTAMAERPLSEWPGTLGLTEPALDVMQHYAASKAAWADVYLATGSWEAAQAAVPQPIHPNPGATQFDDKLRILRTRNQSFFSGNPERGDYMPWLADDAFRMLVAEQKK